MSSSDHISEGKQEFGQKIPDFRLAMLDGSGHRALSDFVTGRKGALIAFWSGICTHCVRYDAYFNSFAQSHPQLGFAAIASRYGETPEQMRKAVEQRHLSFPILLDPSRAVARQWHSQQTPRCYLIDAEKRLYYRGAVDNFKLGNDRIPYLEPAIHSFLAGEKIARPETASFGCAVETIYYRFPKYL